MRAFALLFVLFAARPLLACSVCGCDPAAGTLGLDRPSTNSLRLGLEGRYLSKESGSGDEAEGERENRLLLRAQFAPLPRLVLQAEMPWFLSRDHQNAAGLTDDTARGLGDVTFSARAEVIRLGLEARHVVALIGSVKAPTGANTRSLDGEEPDEHLQLGTGSWDEQLGVSYLYGPRPWTLFANVTGRLNGENGRGFRYGNALFTTAGARRAFFDDGSLLVSLEGQLRYAGEDHGSADAHDDDSGGTVLYATASVAYALTDSLLLRGVVQQPTVTALNGVQSEHTVFYAGLSWDWSL